MDYRRIYQDLVSKAANEGRCGYTERHHILPKCLGGSDDASNIVRLSAREHFVAHQLLVKLNPGHRGLSWALFLMCGKNKYTNGKFYAWAKQLAAGDIRRMQKGRSYPMTEAKRRQYESRKGIPLSATHRANVSAANKGKKRSEETRKRISESAKNRPPVSEAVREKLRQSMIGNTFSKGIKHKPEVGAKTAERMKGNKYSVGFKHSEESIRKIAKFLTGRSPSAETRKKLSVAHRVFSDEQILAVRKDARETNLTQKQIGLKHGISQPHVSRIVRGTSNKDLV